MPPTATDPAPIATHLHRELHASRYGLTLAVTTLIPAALLAPLLQWAIAGPRLAGLVGLGRCFLIAAMLIGLPAAVVLLFWPGARLQRTVVRISIFQHGVELRDGADALLGATSDGTLRVTSVNIQIGRQLSAAAQLVHRGGTLTLRPTRTLAPTPGQPATPHDGRWIALPDATYTELLRFAA